jgi:hypothetical protein
MGYRWNVEQVRKQEQSTLRREAATVKNLDGIRNIRNIRSYVYH